MRNMADFFELNTIDDVDQSANQYILKHWGVKFIIPAIFLIILAVMEAYYYDESSIFMWMAIVWIIGGATWAQSIARKEFMRQFAKSNGMFYAGNGDPEVMKGNLFKKGNLNSRSVTHLVEGERNGRRVRFFFFTYSIGSGRHKQTHDYSVCEIFFNGHAPDITVESKSDWDFMSYSRDRQKEMPIEGFFKKHFGVYVPEDFEIETLEIFTPEVMEYLIDHAKKFNFEFVEDRLYVFRRGLMAKKAELQEFLSTANYLIGKLAPRIFALHDDVAALKNLNNISV